MLQYDIIYRTLPYMEIPRGDYLLNPMVSHYLNHDLNCYSYQMITHVYITSFATLVPSLVSSYSIIYILSAGILIPSGILSAGWAGLIRFALPIV